MSRTHGEALQRDPFVAHLLAQVPENVDETTIRCYVEHDTNQWLYISSRVKGEENGHSFQLEFPRYSLGSLGLSILRHIVDWGGQGNGSERGKPALYSAPLVSWGLVDLTYQHMALLQAARLYVENQAPAWSKPLLSTLLCEKGYHVTRGTLLCIECGQDRDAGSPPGISIPSPCLLRTMAEMEGRWGFIS